MLSSYAGWRWNFFINVPVGVVMSVVIARVVPAHEPGETRAGLDVPGATLVTAGLMAAVFYFSQSPDWGWADPRTLPALAGALALLALFVLNEQRARHPLVPLAIFRNRNLSGANAAMAAVYAGNLAMAVAAGITLLARSSRPPSSGPGGHGAGVHPGEQVYSSLFPVRVRSVSLSSGVLKGGLAW